MLHLNSGDSISGVLSGSPTTNEPTVLVRYRNGGVVRSALLALNGPTPVQLLAGNGPQEVNIDSIFVANLDTQPVSFTLSASIGGTTANLVPLTLAAGDLATIDENMNVTVVNSNGQFKQSNVASPGFLTLSGTTDAVPPHAASTYFVTGAAIDAMTLAAPTPGADDGKQITLVSQTAYAHTLTATGLLQTGAAAVNVATFAAHAGASLTLEAYQGKWAVVSQNAITFS